MTTEMVFDPTVVDEIDQSTVEQNGPQFPIVQWHYGDPKNKKFGAVMDYLGGWFIPESAAPTDLAQHGWEPTSWTHPNGDETDGFWKPEISVSIIHIRKRWEVFRRDERRTYYFSWRDYEKAKQYGTPKGRMHALVLIKGLEEYGPFVLTLKGMSGMYFTGTRQIKGAIAAFSGTVVQAANETIRKGGKRGVMPWRAFWLTVGANRDSKGNAVFTEVGVGTDKSNLVMPVAIGLPAKPEQVDLGQFFVGRDLLGRTTELWNENTEWAKAWDTIEPDSGDGENDEPEAATATPEEVFASEPSLDDF